MLVDKNGNKVVEGCYIRLIGCNVKNDNGIYIVETDYNTNENVRTHDEYLLEKVNTDGTKSKTKYNLFFLDGVNPQKKDKNLDFEVVALENLKKARKEVSDFLKGITASETVYTFTDSEVKTAEELKKGMVVKIVKPLLLKGHINSFRGSYIVKSATSEGFTLHLLGKKGKEVTSNFNCYTMQESYYQGQPVTLKFKAEVIQQLFDENYIIIQERNETTKGELKQSEQPQKEEQKTETEETATENITEVTEEKTEEQTTETNTEETKTTVNAAYTYDIAEDTDTRDNSKIWVVKVREKVEDFSALRTEMKKVDAYYSKFKHGFIFKYDPTEVLNGEISYTENREEEPVKTACNIETELPKEEVKKTIEFDISEDKSPFDNKKIIYLVKVKNEISKQEFTEVKQMLAKLNGFYSSLKDGFIFKYDPKEKLII